MTYREVPIRRVARLGSGHTPSRQHPEYWQDCTIPWLTLADVSKLRDGARTVIDETEQMISEVGVANSAAVVHPAGTVALSRTASVGFSCILGRDMATSQDFATWTCGSGISPRYLLYALRARPEQIRERMTGSTHKTIYMPDIETLTAPLPSTNEQQAITDLLDVETERIDATIARKERIAALLIERWAVVRGQLTMLGEPCLQACVQIRRIASVQAGAAFPHDTQNDPSGTIPYLKVRDLTTVDEFGYVRQAKNHVTDEVARSLRSPVLPPETIVLPKIGAALLTNRRAILAMPSCLDQNVMGVIVKEGNPRYVYHCLSSIDLGELSTPGPVPLLNEDAALSVRIAWPSKPEQDQLVETLDRLEAQNRRPLAALQRQIALLQERRQALITAAVTGHLYLAREMVEEAS